MFVCDSSVSSVPQQQLLGKMTSIADLKGKKNKKNNKQCINNPVFKVFSTSQLLFLQLSMIPSQVSFCLVDDCPLVVTSTKRPGLESILQLQVVNATCIQQHSAGVPFL